MRTSARVALASCVVALGVALAVIVLQAATRDAELALGESPVWRCVAQQNERLPACHLEADQHPEDLDYCPQVVAACRQAGAFAAQEAREARFWSAYRRSRIAVGSLAVTLAVALASGLWWGVVRLRSR